MVIPVWHRDEFPAEAGDVKIEGGICPCRSNDLVARAHKEPDQIAEEAVNALTHHDVLRTDTMMVG